MLIKPLVVGGIKSSQSTDTLRFHGIEENPYPLPNDDEELERLENLHDALRNLLDGNVLAPISLKATNILDVGCGSGQWCLEVANEFPSAVVKGIDLSPIQPEWVPLNVDFIVGDLNQGLDFDWGSHDLVHSRYDVTIYALVRHLLTA